MLVWGENQHEKNDPRVQEIYPDGMHETIRAGIESLLGAAATVRTTTLDEPEHGLTQEVLDSTDVLIWWGHMAHDDVADEVVDRVQEAVLSGMGLIALHSAHFSKIFRRLMGTSCTLRWRNEDDRELLWTVNPTHPIAAGVPHPLVLDQHEMYGEFFDIPAPDELIFISTFTGGEAFRSGATFRRGYGKVFYFSPGDQDYPIYHHPDVQRVIANGVTWAAPATRRTPQLARYRAGDFFAGEHPSAAERFGGSDRMTAFRTLPDDGARLRAIVVGAGPMGQGWLQTLGASDQIDTVGLVDLNLDAARAAAPGLPVATSITELIETVDADVVVNVTVPVAHHAVSDRGAAGRPARSCRRSPSPRPSRRGCRWRRQPRTPASC